MMRNQYGVLLFSLIIILICQETIAQNNSNYSVANIPDSLLKNADVVYRLNESKFEMKSIGKGVHKVKQVITIFNNKASGYADFQAGYYKLMKLHFTGGIIYDKHGTLIKKIKPKDIIDVKTVSSGTLFDDSRVKYYDCLHGNFPFTIAYEYEYAYDGLLQLPTQILVPNYNVSVQKFSFEVIVPKDLDIRIKEVRLPYRGTSMAEAELIRYSWNYENIKAIIREPFSDFLDRASIIYLAPNKFEIEGYEGSQATWKDFGLWNAQLFTGVEALPQETVYKMKELTATATSDLEKAETIYKYMQDKTRYVGVQLGIGGWKPFSAETVDELSYGDCKALANYTKSLLSCVGVKSYYTLVRAGEDIVPLRKDFPSNQFNHAFLTLPMEKDTVWLECTSQSEPFGYQGTFTDDRDVLMITEKGGELIHTRRYDENDNQMISKAKVNLSIEGHSTTKIDRSYHGVFYDDVEYFLQADKTGSKEAMQQDLDIPSYELVDFGHEEVPEMVPSVKEHITLNINNYAKQLGGRVIFTPNLLSREEKALKGPQTRNSVFKIKRSKTWIDSVEYQLPPTYKLSKVPEAFSIESKFGTYRCELQDLGGKLLFVRKRVEFKGEHQPSEYDDFYNYCLEVSKKDNAKVVLVKN